MRENLQTQVSSHGPLEKSDTHSIFETPMNLFHDGQNPILIFCDGACSGNPGPGGWGTIVVRPAGEVQEIGGWAPETTNNQMELTAAIRGLESIRQVIGPVQIYTDSVYVIRGITQWIWGWRKRGWKNSEGQDVANRDFWEALARAVRERGPESPISWHFVRGHSGVPGNERVDEIAVAFTKKQRIQLYNGSLLNYGVAIHDIPDNTDLPEMKTREKKNAAHSYLSLVNGIPMRHASWPECERRTKGVSGARFKKAMSPEEDAEILAAWGVSLDS